MKCEQPIYAAGSADHSGPGQSSGGNPSMPLTPTPGESTASGSKSAPGGGQVSGLIAPSCPKESRPDWMVAWISLQRGFLAEIFPPLERAQDLGAQAPDPLTPDASEQLTFGDLDGSFSRTAPTSGPKDETKSQQTWWREDTAGVTESLPRLMSEPRTSETAGICLHRGPTLLASDGMKNTANTVFNSGAPHLRGWVEKHLPTLTASDGRGGPGNQGRQGGVNLRTAIRTLPTLCATDYKSPYSEAGYQAQRLRRSKPLRDTAAHTIGIRLCPTFCEWWMGWPLGSTVAVESKPSETPGSRSKRRRPGKPSADQ